MSRKTRHGSSSSSSPWASDESTENLLGSILDDTLEAATQEAEELDHALLESSRHQEEERRAQELARQHANAQAIAKEEDRQRQAHKRRTAALEAIRASDHKGEVVQEHVTGVGHEPAPQHTAAPITPVMLHPAEPVRPGRELRTTPTAPPARHANPMLLAGLGALAIALIATTSLLAALMFTGYHVDQTSYPKTLMQPRSAKDPLTSASYQPVPKPELIPRAVEEPSKQTRRGSTQHTKPHKGATANKPSSAKPEESGDRIKDIFGEDDTDIFGKMDKFGSDL